MSPTETRFRIWLADVICPKCKSERLAAAEERIATQAYARHLFHQLWTKAAESPDYNKEQWTELGTKLEQLGVSF